MKGPTLLLVGAVSAALMAAAPAQAALTWQAPETLAGTPGSLSLGPDGTGLLSFAAAGGSYDLAARPLGGPTGAAQALPAPMGTLGGAPVTSWFPDGSSLIGDPNTNRIAFRPAGANANVGPPQVIPGGLAAIATVASGEALIGFDGATTAPSSVALRAAGPGGTVGPAQTLGSVPGRLVGVALDPAGSAVAVWISGNTIYQSVRAANSPSFATPTIINTTTAHPYKVHWAEDSSGYALLAYSDNGDSKVIVSQRAPGGSFGPEQTVATNGGGEVLPAVTSTGDALVAYTGNEATPNNCSAYGSGNDSNAGALYVTAHNGAWGSPEALASSTWPVISLVDAVAGSGGAVALAYRVRTDHNPSPPCNAPVSDSDTLYVQTGHTTSTGIALDAPLIAASEVPLQNDPYQRYYSPSLLSMSINPSGGVLFGYLDAAYPPPVRLLVREDRSTGGGGGTTGTGSGGTSTGGGATSTSGGGTGRGGGSTGGKIVPIVPRDLVVPAPIRSDTPTVTALCPRQVADECALRVAVYAAFGAVPHPAADRTTKRKKAVKRAVLFATGRAIIRPGRRAKIKLTFTAAGRRALRLGRNLKVRLSVAVVYDRGHHAGFLRATTITVRPRHKRLK